MNRSIRHRSCDRHIRGALKLRSSSAQPSATSMSASSNNALSRKNECGAQSVYEVLTKLISQRHRRNRQAKKLRLRLKSNRVSSGNPFSPTCALPRECIYSHEASARWRACHPSVYQGSHLTWIGRCRNTSRALGEGLVLILSPGRFALVHSVQLHDPAFLGIVAAWCCNRHHKSALTVSSARLTLSGRCHV